MAMESVDSPIFQHALLLEEAERIAGLGTFEWHLASGERIWTPGLWRLFGRAPRPGGPRLEEFLSWVHPDDLEDQRRLQLGLLEDPRSWETAYRVVKPDGEVAYLRTRGLLASADGPTVIRGTVQDITTERLADKALRRGERRFRTLTSNAPVGIVELDTEGRCVFVNERFCELSGIPQDHTAEWGWMGALRPDERETVLADGFRAARGGGELVREHRMIRTDGKLVWISARTAPLRDESGATEGYIVTCTDITEMKEANRALEEAEARFGNAFDEAPIGMALISPPGGFLRVNSELVRMTGYSQEQLLAMNLQELSAPDELAETLELIRRVLEGEARTFSVERRYRRSDGELAWVDLSVSVVRDESGPLYMVAQIEDVSERRRADEAVRAAEARFRSAFDSAPIGMVITDLDGRFEHVNPALCDITGYSREELEDMNFHTITPPEDLVQSDRAVEQMIRGELSVHRTEKRYIHADGHLVPIEISATVVRDADGQPLKFLTQIQDITERKLFEGRLQHLADHDSLTGLFNRRRFEEELERELALAERYGASAAVLAIDIDNFKYINDSLGHSTGDQLIARVGEALVARLRKTDVIARLGGDEFAVILPHADEDEASGVAESLLQAVGSVDLQAIGSRGRNVTASIGISVFEPGSRLSADELLVEADIAMYDAKEAGRARATVYNAGEERGQRMQARITWADRVREALADERFVLHAQEIRSLTGDPVPRFELLLRMLSATGELIPPASFLQVAERFDLIQEIDCWVVQSAARILAAQQAAGRELVLSVNLSAKSITDPEVPLLIARALEEEGADPHGLSIEVTETAAIVNVERAKDFARAVGELGCELSLDDFGSGFASFYYLKHLAFDVLKIDGEFVRDLTTSRMNQLLVRSVVDIARGLDKRTVAEFVGDQPTLEMLRDMGVDFAQGFHVSKPQPLDALGLSSHIESLSSGSKP
jgi:diguanylate cyclase (GGDEF)-like protein/PAS domain S-box-containing protein